MIGADLTGMQDVKRRGVSGSERGGKSDLGMVKLVKIWWLDALNRHIL